MKPIFHLIKELVPSTGSWVDSVKIRFPSSEDYKLQKIALPYYQILKIDEIFKQNPFCVIYGNRNSGKSWLIFLYYFFKQQNEKIPIFTRISQQIRYPGLVPAENIFQYIEVSSSFNAIAAWDEIYVGFKNGNHSAIYYYVLDDCHDNPEETLKFFEIAYLHINEDTNLQQHLKIIFSTRKIASKILKDDPIDNFLYSYANQTKCLVFTYQTITNHPYFNNIIKNYITYAKISVDFQTIQPDIDRLYEKIGYDLLHLKVILSAWQRSPKKRISEIGLTEIYESFWALDGEIRLNDNIRREPLLQLSLLCQFESIYVFEDSPIIQKYFEIYRQLKKEGLIQYTQKENDYYYNIDPSLAWLILGTIQTFDYSRRSNGHFIENETVSIFQRYISDPSPPNVSLVLLAIIDKIKNDNDNFAKQVFISYLFEEASWKKIKITILSFDLLSFCKFTSIFHSKFGVLINSPKQHLLYEKENELIREYLEIQKEQIREIFLTQNLRSFYKNLRCLNQFSYPSNVLSFLTEQNILDIFKTGTFSQIYRINQFCIEYKIIGLQIKLLIALNSMDISTLLNQDERALRRIYGFIRDEEIFRKKHENATIHNLNLQFIEKCIQHIILKDNFTLLVINNDKILSDPSEDNYYSPFFIMGEIIGWLIQNNAKAAVESLKKNILDFNWSVYLYNKDYPSKVIEANTGTFQYLATKYFRNLNQKKRLFSNYTIENFKNIYTGLSLKNKFYLIWHLYIYNKTLLLNPIALRSINESLNFSNWNMEEKETHFIYPIFGLYTLCDLKYLETTIPEDLIIQNLTIILHDYSKMEKQPITQVVLTLVSARQLLNINTFSEIKKTFQNMRQKIQKMPEKDKDQKEILLQLFDEL